MKPWLHSIWMQDVCENVLWDLDYQNTCEVGGLEAFLYCSVCNPILTRWWTKRQVWTTRNTKRPVKYILKDFFSQICNSVCLTAIIFYVFQSTAWKSACGGTPLAVSFLVTDSVVFVSNISFNSVTYWKSKWEITYLLHFICSWHTKIYSYIHFHKFMVGVSSSSMLCVIVSFH